VVSLSNHEWLPFDCSTGLQFRANGFCSSYFFTGPYREFLLQNHDPEVREYPEAADQLRELLVHENYLSQKDIEICLGFDLADIVDQPEIDSIRTPPLMPSTSFETK